MTSVHGAGGYGDMADEPWGQLSGVLTRWLPKFTPHVIVDVGANVGGTAMAFSGLYPEATVHAIEPVSGTYGSLVALTKGCAGIRTYNVALSQRDGRQWMEVPEDTKLARIVSRGGGSSQRESVETITGDAFCQRNSIARVDILKIDTEGHDLRVLRGFGDMLGGQAIGVIDVEAGIDIDNHRHVPLWRLQRLLHRSGYSLLWMHEMTLDWYFSGRPVLRRVNAVFVSEAVVTSNLTTPRYRASA